MLCRNHHDWHLYNKYFTFLLLRHTAHTHTCKTAQGSEAYFFSSRTCIVLGSFLSAFPLWPLGQNRDGKKKSSKKIINIFTWHILIHINYWGRWAVGHIPEQEYGIAIGARVIFAHPLIVFQSFSSTDEENLLRHWDMASFLYGLFQIGHTERREGWNWVRWLLFRVWLYLHISKIAIHRKCETIE